MFAEIAKPSDCDRDIVITAARSVLLDNFFALWIQLPSAHRIYSLRILDLYNETSGA